jgi:hypothetical protein
VLCDAKQERKEPKERIEVRTLIHLFFNPLKGKLIERKTARIHLNKTATYTDMDERGGVPAWYDPVCERPPPP